MPLTSDRDKWEEHQNRVANTEPEEEKRVPLVVAVAVIIGILAVLCLALIGTIRLFF